MHLPSTGTCQEPRRLSERVACDFVSEGALPLNRGCRVRAVNLGIGLGRRVKLRCCFVFSCTSYHGLLYRWFPAPETAPHANNAVECKLEMEVSSSMNAAACRLFWLPISHLNCCMSILPIGQDDRPESPPRESKPEMDEGYGNCVAS